MMVKTMTEILRAASTDFRNASHVSKRNATARTSTPRTPKAADSVGVAMPRMINPTTANTTSPIGKMFVTTSLSRTPSDTLSTGYCGAASGSSFT